MEAGGVKDMSKLNQKFYDDYNQDTDQWSEDMTKLHNDAYDAPDFVEDTGDYTGIDDNTFDEETTGFVKDNHDKLTDQPLEKIFDEGVSSPATKEAKAKDLVDAKFKEPMPREAFLNKLKSFGHTEGEKPLTSEAPSEGINVEGEPDITYPQTMGKLNNLNNASFNMGVLDSILKDGDIYTASQIAGAESDKSTEGVIKLTAMKLVNEFATLLGKDTFSDEIKVANNASQVEKIVSDIAVFLVTSIAVGGALKGGMMLTRLGLRAYPVFKGLSKMKKLGQVSKLGKSASTISERIGMYFKRKAIGVAKGAPNTLGTFYLTTDVRQAIESDAEIQESFQYILSNEYGKASMIRAKEAFKEFLYTIPMEMGIDTVLGVGRLGAGKIGGLIRGVMKNETKPAIGSISKKGKSVGKATEKAVEKSTKDTGLATEAEIKEAIHGTAGGSELREATDGTMKSILGTEATKLDAEIAKASTARDLRNLTNPRYSLTEDVYKNLMKQSKKSETGYVVGTGRTSIEAHANRETFNDVRHNVVNYEILKTRFGDIFEVKNGVYTIKSAKRYIARVARMPKGTKKEMVQEFADNLLKYTESNGRTTVASGRSANTATGAIKDQISGLTFVDVLNNVVAEDKVRHFIEQIDNFSSPELSQLVHIFSLNTLNSVASKPKVLSKFVTVLPDVLHRTLDTATGKQRSLTIVKETKEIVQEMEKATGKKSVKATEKATEKTLKEVVPEIVEEEVASVPDLDTSDVIYSGLTNMIVNAIASKVNYVVVGSSTAINTGLNLFSAMVGTLSSTSMSQFRASRATEYMWNYSKTYLSSLLDATVRQDASPVYKAITGKLGINGASKGIAKNVGTTMNFARNILSVPSNLLKGLKGMGSKAASHAETETLLNSVIEGNMAEESKNLIRNLLNENNNNWREALSSSRKYADATFLKKLGVSDQVATTVAKDVEEIVKSLEGFGTSLKTLNRSGSTYISNLERSGSAFIKLATVTSVPTFGLSEVMTATPYSMYANTSSAFEALNSLNRGRALVGMSLYDSGIKAVLDSSIVASVKKSIKGEGDGETGVPEDVRNRELLRTMGADSNIILNVEGRMVPLRDCGVPGLVMALPSVVAEAQRLAGGQFTDSEMEYVVAFANNLFKALKVYISDMTRMNTVFEKGMGRSVYKVLQAFQDPVALLAPSVSVFNTLKEHIGEEEAMRTVQLLNTITRGGNEAVRIHSAITGKALPKNSLFFDATEAPTGVAKELIKELNWVPRNLKVMFKGKRLTDSEMEFVASHYNAEEFRKYAITILAYYKSSDVSADEAIKKLEVKRNTLEAEAYYKLFLKNEG